MKPTALFKELFQFAAAVAFAPIVICVGIFSKHWEEWWQKKRWLAILTLPFWSLWPFAWLGTFFVENF